MLFNLTSPQLVLAGTALIMFGLGMAISAFNTISRLEGKGLDQQATYLGAIAVLFVGMATARSLEFAGFTNPDLGLLDPLLRVVAGVVGCLALFAVGQKVCHVVVMFIFRMMSNIRGD